jgi:hypothetical protein
MVVVPQRAPKEKSTDPHDQYTARQLELRRAAADRKQLADDGETGEHQHHGKPDMSDCQDRTIGNSVTELSRLTEVIRDKDGLAVAHHQSVDGAEKYRRGEGCEDRSCVACGEVSKPAGNALIEPALCVDQGSHGDGRPVTPPCVAPRTCKARPRW